MCIDNNLKTIKSYDNNRDCKYGCVYCYVTQARIKNFNAKKVIDYIAYNHEVLKYKQPLIDKLNSIGGMRMFSFGDYHKKHDKDILSFLNDCLAIGLKVKAITKQSSFIYKFGNHKAINVIHISIDNIKNGVTWKTAKKLRTDYKKVLIRCVILKDEDIKPLMFSDIFTFNHATGLKKHGFKKYNKKEVNLWNNKLNNKVCCSGGNCSTCQLKCGCN